MKSVYPAIFTPLRDEKDTILIEVPDLEILTEGFGMRIAPTYKCYPLLTALCIMFLIDAQALCCIPI